MFEFITGGGLSGQSLPDTLLREGEIMIQTLLNELLEAGYTDISLTRDNRVKSLKKEVVQHTIERPLEEELPKLIKESDISWLIAPETGDCLVSLAELFIEHGKVFIGSSPDAIRVAASKSVTSKILAEANINVIETKLLNDVLPDSQTGWIIKPDDGVGGESCCFINDKNKLSAIIRKEKNNNFIIQPFIEGKHMSMSLLVFDHDVRLLACNEQYINIKNDSASLIAIGVNECLSFKNEMMELAKSIVSKISGFAGYIGVDLIATKDELFVLEINPRFTTAYAGLSKSLGCNITAKILNTFLKKKLPEIDLAAAIPVRINV
ncbi:MAG: ATP-grasp domain-containing protein [Proteobacteria bacterium]|nr:ATP-grasp domain-containing protein [Pseudomonadota bacterium]